MTLPDIKDRAPSGRATSMAGFGALIGLMGTEAGLAVGLSLELRPTDIVITPFGKSGTTWLQQMAHTLRTRGDRDFDDISRVAPWIEASADLGIDLNAEQKANPRIFKSHLDAHRIPKGARYIVSSREPGDALYSMYKFMEGWFLEPGAVSLDDFAGATFIAAGNASDHQRANYWTHLRSWWERRNDPNVLFMAYEHMKQDPEATIRKVAAFMDIDLDTELLATTSKHSSLAFMQDHQDLFDDKLMREHSMKVAGLPADSDSSKVRTGQVGQAHRLLSADVTAELDALWQEHITATLGFKNYAAMIEALA